MKQVPLRDLGYAIGFVVLLVAIYVGAYYAMVGRNMATLSDPDGSNTHRFATPTYLFGGKVARDFFYPAHAFDKMIRSDFWPWEK